MKRRGAVLVALTFVLALGTLTLWTPLSTDQAIFTYGAKTIASGETLYVDFWDVKPPGIFYFYALGGALFGFQEPGIHLLELLWMLAAAALLTGFALRCVERPAAAALAPIAALGVYYAFAGPDHRTQVEALVALPLALALAAAAALADKPRSAGWGFALGVAVGGVAAFKPVYLPLPIAFALLAAGTAGQREGPSSVRHLPRLAIFGSLGVLAVWGPILGHFAAHGAVEELLWTKFRYPFEAVTHGFKAPASRLAASLGWAGGLWWPWLPLVLLGLVPRRGEPPVLRWGALVYLVFAMALIAIQTISWWSYHMVLLFPALGLLAARGLDRLAGLVRRAGRRRLARTAAVALVLALPAGSIVRQSIATYGRLAAAGSLTTDADLAVRLDPRYWEFWSQTAFLREGGEPGTIYVFGDIRILLLSGRRQAIPVHGHGWALFPDRLWSRLPAELMAAEPAYVYWTPYNRTVLERRAPELVEFLERRYVPVRKIAEGRLLALRP